MKICILSLGCKVNQYECEALAKNFDNLNYEVITHLDYADVYILNTCAVTNEAEKKSRQYINKIQKCNENAKIYVIGCASQANSSQFETKNNVIYICGNNNKNQLIEAIKLDLKGNFVEDVEKEYLEIDYIKATSNNLTEKVRKYIKIQDGCNNFCTYCIIPYLRGRSRSRNLESILNEINDVSKIANEIVLTGINISDYKIDGKLALTNLFENLKECTSRIRIGSLEVNIIDENLLKTLKTVKNFAPHFHLSLQSGCNRILKLMNRHYTVQDFLQKVELIRKYFPDSAITTDLIVGFAKETDEDFNETLETIKSAQFSDMHIFEYSEKNGTKGVKLGKSSSQEIKSRLKKVNELKSKLKDEFIKNRLGKTYSILIEEHYENFSIGLTDNYLKIFVEGKFEINKFYNVKLEKIENGNIIGTIVN